MSRPDNLGQLPSQIHRILHTSLNALSTDAAHVHPPDASAGGGRINMRTSAAKKGGCLMETSAPAGGIARGQRTNENLGTFRTTEVLSLAKQIPPAYQYGQMKFSTRL
jgi:hypothetical protein